MINQKTIDRTLHFLNECKTQIGTNGTKFNPKKVSKECHVSNAKFWYAIKLDYFHKRFYPTGSRYFCNVESFEPCHARKLINAENHTKQKADNLLFKTKVSNVKESNIIKPLSKIPPSLEDVKQYCDERKNNINPVQFMSYYESNGWKVGKDKMKDWKASVRYWETRKNYPTIIKKENLAEYSNAELYEKFVRIWGEMIARDLLTEALRNSGYSGELNKKISF